eukprot:366429-Chlamydomonas_euryale.AAC.4
MLAVGHGGEQAAGVHARRGLRHLAQVPQRRQQESGGLVQREDKGTVWPSVAAYCLSFCWPRQSAQKRSRHAVEQRNRSMFWNGRPGTA